jgi:hypothetical protein
MHEWEHSVGGEPKDQIVLSQTVDKGLPGFSSSLFLSGHGLRVIFG